jgi:tight adherence protein C
MPIYVLIAALAVSASIPILWWTLASDRRSAVAADSASGFNGQSSDARGLVLKEGAGDRVVRPALKSVAATVTRVTPVGWVSSLRHNLTLGGHYSDTHALERALVFKFVLGVAGILMAWVLFPNLGGWQRIAVVVLFGAVGFFMPDALIARRGRQRQEQIQLEMPDTLDQLTMSVEAGLGFEAALARAARTGDGPLAAELNRTIREIQLGIPRDQALRNLADRTDVPDLDSFVLAVVQSEKYGIGIGQVLRVQAAELRDKRRERAEERALKIPVLILFPLVLCIFPVIFIVLLGPAAIQISDVFSSL